MEHTPRLPDGLRSRPLSQPEATAVYAVAAACEEAELGRQEIEEADIVGDWARPSFDVATQTVGVFDGDRLVGYAEVSGHDRGDAAVHPDYYGRGIGTWLAHWMQDRTRARGGPTIGMPVPQGSTGDRLLAALGYRVRWTSWVLQLPPGATIVDRPLPSGYGLREAAPADYPGVYEVVEDAFLEWSVREREPYDDFLASITGRPGYAPWQVRIVTGPDGAVVGVAIVTISDYGGDRPLEAYISRLAVRHDQRGRGLAQALMVDAFAEARARGALTCGLSTDSRTGALDLYVKVGMEVTDVWVNRAIDV